MGGTIGAFLMLVCLFSRGVCSADELAISPWPPIALHPDNPRYFLWRDKPTILVTSGEHYGAC